MERKRKGPSPQRKGKEPELLRRKTCLIYRAESLLQTHRDGTGISGCVTWGVLGRWRGGCSPLRAPEQPRLQPLGYVFISQGTEPFMHWFSGSASLLISCALKFLLQVLQVKMKSSEAFFPPHISICLSLSCLPLHLCLFFLPWFQWYLQVLAVMVHLQGITSNSCVLGKSHPAGTS